MALRDESCGRMTAMRLIPCGDWRMSLQNRCDNKAYLRIGASERLCVELKSGGSPPPCPICRGTHTARYTAYLLPRERHGAARACTTSNSRWQ